MSSKLYQRMITGLCAFIIVATGVFAPLSFGIVGNNFQDPTEASSFAILQPLVAYAQGSLDTTTGQLQNLENVTFNKICGETSLMTIVDAEQIGCNIVLWATKGAFKISGILAAATGGLFDYMLWFTIQSSTYAQSDFIETGWGILRDLANIVFIIALIIAALNIMLSGVVSIGSRDGKKMLASVIVAALLVNFSLFFAQVIVDASHILARTFYNRIDTDVSEDATGNFGDGEKPQTAVSVALLVQINPQELVLDPEVLAASSFGWTTVIALYTFMTIIHGVLIFIFLSMALMFIGRTVALMFGMIISPFAFATLGTPMQDLPYVGFSTWIKDLAKNAFMVPVFLFFLYLTVLFMSGALGDIAKDLGEFTGKTLGQKMIDLLIPMSLIIGLLMGGKSAAGKMASEIASQANSLVGKGVGLLAGSALTVGAGALTMGTARISRGLGSLAGDALARGAAESEKGNKITGALLKGLGSGTASISDKVKGANVDVRSSFLGKQAAGALGAAGFGSIGLGEGRYTSAQAAEDKKMKEAKERRERELRFMNQEIEKKKTKKEEEKAGAQAEKDKIEGSKEFRDGEEKLENDIKVQEKKVQEKKDQLKQAKQDIDTAKQAVAPGSDPDKDPDVIAKQAIANQKQREVDEEKEKKETMDKMLEDGSFMYKGTDPTDDTTFGKTLDSVADALKDEAKALEDLAKRERQGELAGKSTPTPAERLEIAQLNKDLGSSYSKAAHDSAKQDVKDARDVINRDPAMRYKRAGDTIGKVNKDIKQLDRQMNANKSKLIKQELDIMNSGMQKLALALASSIPGAVIAGVIGGLTGLPLGTMLGAGLMGGGLYAGVNYVNNAAHGFDEKDRAQLQQLFRNSGKSKGKKK